MLRSKRLALTPSANLDGESIGPDGMAAAAVIHASANITARTLHSASGPNEFIKQDSQ